MLSTRKPAIKRGLSATEITEILIKSATAAPKPDTNSIDQRPIFKPKRKPQQPVIFTSFTPSLPTAAANSDSDEEIEIKNPANKDTHLQKKARFIQPANSPSNSFSFLPPLNLASPPSLDNEEVFGLDQLSIASETKLPSPKF